jgi:hypothetical protein
VKCVTPHASISEASHLSVAQPPLCVTKYTILDLMLPGIMQECSCSFAPASGR